MTEKIGDKLGFWSIVLLAINAIIGSGIFLTPGSVATAPCFVKRSSRLIYCSDSCRNHWWIRLRTGLPVQRNDWRNGYHCPNL